MLLFDIFEEDVRLNNNIKGVSSKEYALYFLYVQVLALCVYELLRSWNDLISCLVLSIANMWWLIAFTAILGVVSLKCSLKRQRSYLNLFVSSVLPIVLFENAIIAWVMGTPLYVALLISLGIVSLSFMIAGWRTESIDNPKLRKSVRKSKAIFGIRIGICAILLFASVLTRVYFGKVAEELGHYMYDYEYNNYVPDLNRDIEELT